MPRSTDIFYRAVGACFASSLLHSVHAASQPVPSGGQAQLDRNPRHFAMDIMLNQCRGYDAAGLERSLSCAKMVDRLDNALIISGTSNPQLAEEVAWETGKTLAKVSVSRFPDGECTVKLEDNVRGKDVYILQSASAPINDSFVESLLIATAARRADARTVTLLAPSMAYGRSTGSKTASDHSEEGVGVLMNAHQQEEEEGSSTVTSAASGLPRALKALLAAHPWVESSSSSSSSSSGGSSQEEADAINSRLRAEGLAVSTAAAASTLLAAASRSASASRPSTFASPLPAVEANSISAADCALMLVASGVDRVISVELSPAGGGQVEGFFPPQVPVENLRASTILVDFCSKLKLQRPTVVAPNEECIQLAMDIRAGLSQKLPGVDVGLAVIVEMIEPGVGEAKLKLIGDVSGRDLLICDHLIDSARTLEQRVKLLKRAGAGRCVATATHGIFSGRALQRISRSALSDVVITNTVPLRDDVDVRDLHKLSQLSVAPLLASAIIRAQCDLSYQTPPPGLTPSARYAGQGEGE